MKKNLEIHDRVIAATALVSNSLLVTKDSELKKIPGLKTIW
jgi:predicted nucleic acid-binding protein